MDVFKELKKQGRHLDVRDLICNTLNVMRSEILPVSLQKARELRPFLPIAHDGNPSIPADLKAAKSGLLELDRGMRQILRDIANENEDLRMLYIIEEGNQRGFIERELHSLYSQIPNPAVKPINDILASDLVAVVDSVDGSLPFALSQPNLLGIGLPPLFAIGLSIFMNGHCRYSGLWFPQPSIVDSTFILVGFEGEKNPMDNLITTMWRLGSPEINLKDYLKSLDRPTRFNKSFIATHYSRTDPVARRKALSLVGDERLARHSVFALNSGLIALLSVVINGAVAAIPATHVHDLAPALSLLQACNCTFSDWSGNPLDLTKYSPEHRLSIVAACTKELHNSMIEITSTVQ